MRQALITLKDGRQLLATVPSIDGFECAGWDMLVSARDVIEACERDNVRPARPPPAPHRPVCTDSH